MKRSVNFTGRVDLDRSLIQLELEDPGNNPTLNLSWDELDLDDIEATHLVVEARVVGRQLRLPGPADFRAVRNMSMSIRELGARPILRMKFVNAADPQRPRIAAVVDNLGWEASHGDVLSSGFLPALKVRDLDVPWRVNLADGSPVIELRSNNGLSEYLVRNDAAALPILCSAVEQIAFWVFLQNPSELSEEAAKWSGFLQSLGITHNPNISHDDLLDEARQLAQEASAAFARRTDAVRICEANMELEGDDE